MHAQAKDFTVFVQSILKEYFINKKVLDVGSGDINGNNRFLFENCKYEGNDVIQAPNVTIVSKTKDLPYENETFDTIISTECFEHDPTYNESFLKIYDMLKKDGLFWFTCASTGRHEHGTRRSLPQESYGTIGNLEDMSDYYKNLTEKDLNAVLNLNDLFSVWDTYYCNSSKDLYFLGIKKGSKRFDSLTKYIKNDIICTSEHIHTQKEKEFFLKNGYLIIKNVFKQTEMNIVRKSIMDEKFEESKNGGFSSLIVWNNCNGDDIYTRIGKSYKILNTSTFLYDNDVYCYHNKIVNKLPGTKGFKAHQDYGGYWSKMGVDIPDPHACFIAIDECTLENGCLEIIPKSHLLGELPHTELKSDSGIIESKYNELLNKSYKPIPIELNRGDVVFLHGNTIHLSGDNNSNKTRYAMIVTLNTERAGKINKDCLYKNKHPNYSYHERVYDEITEEDLNREKILRQ